MLRHNRMGAIDSAAASVETMGQLAKRSRRLLGLVDGAVIAQKASRMAGELVGTDIACVSLREAPGLMAIRGTWHVRTQDFKRIRVGPGDGLGGKMLMEGAPVSLDRYGRDIPTSRRLIELVGEREGVQGVLAVPLFHDGQLVGAVFAGNRAPGQLGSRTQEVLTELAGWVGPLVGTALQHQRSKETAILSERQRLSGDLHDNLGHLLFGIGALARRVRRSLDPDSADLLASLAEIESQANLAAASLRQALWDLAPSESNGALAAVVDSEVRAFERRTGIAAQAVTIGELRMLPGAIDEALLAVVREGLHNVAKHAAASTVMVTLHDDGQSAGIVVQDAGRGLAEDFAIRSVQRDGLHCGLASLRHRLACLGGELNLIQNEDGGTTLRASVPVE